MMKISAYTLAIAIAAASTEAFVTPNTATSIISQQQPQCALFMAEETESAFIADVDTGAADVDTDKTFDAVEKMGRGAAKVRFLVAYSYTGCKQHGRYLQPGNNPWRGMMSDRAKSKTMAHGGAQNEICESWMCSHFYAVPERTRQLGEFSQHTEISDIEL